MASDASSPFYALIDYQDPYVQPLLLSALQSRLPPNSYHLITSLSSYPSHGGPLLQIRQYESLVFEFALEEPEHCLVNAYVIRKALIRKHYLATTVANWVVKHPSSVLRTHVKPAVDFELDYAEFLDEALVEAYELRESFERNAGKESGEREWWILKPGMSDRGQGIRLFSTEEELTAIFEEWEAEQPDSADDDEAEDQDDTTSQDVSPTASKSLLERDSDAIITSQLRHFVAQPYIHPPLLVDARKFHIRTYVLAVGALQVYVYKPMLALFAAEPYCAPWQPSSQEDRGGGVPDLRAHLTNTCLQSGEREGSVRDFWGLPDDSLPPNDGGSWRDDVFTQICDITAELFEAAARGMMVHFQPLPSAFEVFGVDFMVDAKGTTWLLEVNAFPDFRQTGEELSGVVRGLWEEVVDVAVKPFFGVKEGEAREGTERMRRVLDIDLGRR